MCHWHLTDCTELSGLLCGLHYMEFPGFYFQLQCQQEKAGPMKLHSWHCSWLLAIPTSSSQSWEVELRLQGASWEIVRDTPCLGFAESSANSTTSCHLKSSACCTGRGVQSLLHSCMTARSIHAWEVNYLMHECTITSNLNSLLICAWASCGS